MHCNIAEYESGQLPVLTGLDSLSLSERSQVLLRELWILGEMYSKSLFPLQMRQTMAWATSESCAQLIKESNFLSVLGTVSSFQRDVEKKERGQRVMKRVRPTFQIHRQVQSWVGLTRGTPRSSCSNPKAVTERMEPSSLVLLNNTAWGNSQILVHLGHQ